MHRQRALSTIAVIGLLVWQGLALWPMTCAMASGDGHGCQCCCVNRSVQAADASYHLHCCPQQSPPQVAGAAVTADSASPAVPTELTAGSLPQPLAFISADLESLPQWAASHVQPRTPRAPPTV